MKENVTAPNTEEDIISLSDLFWYMLSKWRKIISLTLVLMILLAVGMGAVGAIQFCDPEEVQRTQENYEYAVNAYNTQKAQLESRMRVVAEQISQQDAYEANSALFAIDPYDVNTVEISYYVDTGFEILPEYLYQNPNYNVPIVSAYATAIRRIPIEELLSGLGPDQFNVEYDKKSDFLSVSTDASNGLLNISAIGASKEQTDIIADAVEKVIRDSYKMINDTIHEHTITCIGRTEFRTISKRLIDLHNEMKDRSASLASSMEEALIKYNNLEEPKDTSISPMNIVINVIKAAILGAVAGCAIGLVYYGMQFIVKGFAAGPKDISRRYNTHVLGVYTQSDKANRMDRKIALARGLDPENTPESTDSLIAANIRQSVQAACRILLVGTVGRERIAAIRDRLAPLTAPCELLSFGNVLEDAASVEALGSCDAVVFIEEIGVSRHEDIIEEMEKAERAGKPVLGFVLTGRARL